jgi:hypothetical protein
MLFQNTLEQTLTRRAFLRGTTGLGGVALASLLDPSIFRGQAAAATSAAGPASVPGALKVLHHPAKAKRVIYLFQSGAPSHLDLFDPKPHAHEDDRRRAAAERSQGTAHHRHDRRTGRAAAAWDRPIPSRPTGRARRELSEMLPHIGSVVDDIALIRSVHTDPINHDPAVDLLRHRQPAAGPAHHGRMARPTGWAAENENLPSYVVLVERQRSGSRCRHALSGQWIPSRPTTRACNSAAQGDPVLYVSESARTSAPSRRRQLLDAMQDLNRHAARAARGSRAIATHIESYELAFRMQTSVPELMDMFEGAEAVLDLVRTEAEASRRFADNCLLARRLAERDVRFIQFCHPRLGPPRGPARRHQGADARTPTRPAARLDHGPQAARPARRHAGDLGRRVRPHRLFAGRASTTNDSVAIIIRAASRCGWPGGGIKPGLGYGRDR